MDYSAVLLVSIALGVDAFSVAIGIGLLGVKLREVLLVSGTVSIFHVFMPLIGLYLGTYLGKIAGPIASTIGALVLLAIGLNMLWDSIRETDTRRRPVLEIKSILSLVLMAGSVSLDALTVGFGLGTLKVDLLLTVITMGITAGLMTATGLVFGQKLSRFVGSKASMLGGIILVLLGLKLLIW